MPPACTAGRSSDAPPTAVCYGSCACAELPPSCSDGEGEEPEAHQGQAEARQRHGDGDVHSAEGYEEEEEEEEEEDTRPPLQPNTNRKVIYHEVSDGDEDSDEG